MKRSYRENRVARWMGAVTARLSFDVSRDPCPPELVFFIRSDQYSFVKQGIPSVFLSAGTKSSVPNIKPQQIITKWRQTTYRKPQDEMNQPCDFESGAKYARYNFSRISGCAEDRKASMECR